MLFDNHKKTIKPYLAIFDLDETLIAADSASLWNTFLVQKGLAPQTLLEEEQRLMQAYAEGTLDMNTYMEATLQPIKGCDITKISALVEDFLEEKIKPALYPDALARIEWHKKRGDHVLIISATSEHLVKPIATMLNVEDVIAIELETINGIFTGNTKGTLSYQQGKVIRMKAWLDNQKIEFKGSYGYSDSINDLPMLDAVDRPFAVNPDPALSLHAQVNDWTIMDWRHDNNILR
ncbi:HAD family hydrolase [Photobacterium indicum]|uniref:HAD family hydrolase n=1 Tax=Photobacterium indicum TaxID=81447 RepID=UPI003D124D4E